MIYNFIYPDETYSLLSKTEYYLVNDWYAMKLIQVVIMPVSLLFKINQNWIFYERKVQQYHSRLFIMGSELEFDSKAL